MKPMPYTPDTAEIRALYSERIGDDGTAFDQWHAERTEQVSREAERRGAEKALTDFKRFVIRVLPKGLVNRASIIADLDESMKRLDETGHLLMGPLEQEDDDE